MDVALYPWRMYAEQHGTEHGCESSKERADEECRLVAAVERHQRVGAGLKQDARTGGGKAGKDRQADKVCTSKRGLSSDRNRNRQYRRKEPHHVCL